MKLCVVENVLRENGRHSKHGHVDGFDSGILSLRNFYIE